MLLPFFLNTEIFKIPRQFLKSRGIRSFLFYLGILKNARGKFKKLRAPLVFKNCLAILKKDSNIYIFDAKLLYSINPRIYIARQ